MPGCTSSSSKDAGARLSHPRLCDIAADLTQTIDGEFRAYRHGESDPWLVIRAVDSSVFDVISDDPAFVDTLRRRLQKVRDYPPSEL